MLRAWQKKELRLEEFNAEETLFLRSIMVAKAAGVMGCGVITFEDVWNGWYRTFYRADDNPALIADVHTNPTNDPQKARSIRQCVPRRHRTHCADLDCGHRRGQCDLCWTFV